MGTDSNYSKEKTVTKVLLQKDKKEISFNSLSKKIIILIIVLLAYTLTYTYIAAQYMYYKIPINFLAFNNYRLIGISVLIFIALIIIYVLIKKLGESTKDTIKTKRMEKSSIMGYAVISIFLVVLFYLNFVNFYAWLAMMVFSLIFLPFFPKTKVPFYLFSILALVSFFLLSAYLGRYTAEHKSAYYVIKSQKQSYVVLDTYKGNFIIAKANLKKKEIDTKFQIIDYKSELSTKSKQTVLELSYTGPLKVNN